MAEIAIAPQDVADSIERAAQILLRPRPPKPRKEETGSGRGDDESFDELASLQGVAGVTRAVTRALSRATSQSLLPTPQQPCQQLQLVEQDSTLCCSKGATEVKEPRINRPIILAETGLRHSTKLATIGEKAGARCGARTYTSQTWLGRKLE